MELIRVHETDSDGLMPQIVVAVPSVNKFLGAFADLYSGLSVCACGERTLYIALSLRTDGQVVASNCASGEHKKYQASSVKFKKEDKWLNYIKSTVLSMENSIKNFSGLTVTLDGDLLECESPMVNSAVVAGLVFGLNSIFKLKLKKNDIFADACNIFTTFCAEVPPLVNLMTMIFSEKEKFILIDLAKQSFSLIPNPFRKSDYRLLLVDGNIPSSAMKEELNYTKDSLRHAVEQFRCVFNRMSFKDFDEWNLKDCTGELNEEDRRLCLYLLSEYRISASFEKALQEGNFASLGRLFSKIEKSIKDDLELTCPEIDWLIKRSSGISACFGSCMIFDGLSGLIAMIIKQSAIESFSSYLEEYDHIFGFDSRTLEFAPVNLLKLIDLNSPALQN